MDFIGRKLLVAPLFALAALLLLPAATFGPARVERTWSSAKATQYLYTSNIGGNPAYGRYSIPDLTLIEVTPDGPTDVAFGKDGLPYYVSTASGPQQTGYAVYEIPLDKGNVPGVEQFAGLCGFGSGDIGSYNFVTGPSGDFYAIQVCTSSIGEWKPAKSGKTLDPYKTFVGGNFGPSASAPTAIFVDSQGGLYVGDAKGGVTYFKPGSTTPVVALATGCCGDISQFAEAKGNVYVTYAGGPSSTFANDKSCLVVSGGPVKRSEVGEVFSQGTFVAHLFSIPEENKKYNIDASSVAVDASGRVYLTVTVPNASILEYPPGQSCPDPSFAFNVQYEEAPKVAVDAEGRYYVIDSTKNTISAYPSASTKARVTVTQPSPLINPLYLTVGP